MKTLTPTMKVIEVTFNTSSLEKLYSYYTHVDVAVGDFVVVRKPSGSPAIVTVIQTEGLSASALQAASKCIICKIDFDEYDKRTEELKLIREIKNELKQRREQLDEMILYSRLAESDPVMKGLVERMNAIIPDAIPTLSPATPPPTLSPVCSDEDRTAGTICSNCEKEIVAHHGCECSVKVFGE